MFNSMSVDIIQNLS